MVMLGQNYYSGKTASEGDVITFIDEGAWVESKFKREDGTNKNSFQIGIQVNTDPKKFILNINKKNSDALQAAFGHETKEWVGRKAEVTIKEIEVASEEVLAIRLAPITA